MANILKACLAEDPDARPTSGALFQSLTSAIPTWYQQEYCTDADLLAAIAYTMTPFKLAYRGLGEVCAFAFFGPIAVLGTLQAQLVAITPLTLGLSCPVGLWVAAIMLVNNLRDHHSDADCGKRTLVVRVGGRFGRLLYGTLITSGFAIPCALVAGGLLDAKALLVLVAIPLTIAPTQAVFAPIDGPRLNQALGQTARLTLVAGSLLALGVAL